MIYQFRHGWYLFTASCLNRSRTFIHFREGIDWVFTQKLAAACAESMAMPS